MPRNFFNGASEAANIMCFRHAELVSASCCDTLKSVQGNLSYILIAKCRINVFLPAQHKNNKNENDIN